ncbi:hypothetical protein H5410_043234 [Solanum commersonii]|uniref:Uncharacterized protein n=1 Tax=Solanum commersonii TaxID=4109 RepID=A0A9J5XZP2_SOLCO|nr:hypothetical protein H5410_043234 [Solanum commersonii]
MGSSGNRLWLWYDIWIVDGRPHVPTGKTKIAEDIAQQIAANKRTRQKKRRQRCEFAGELDKFISNGCICYS